MYKKEAQRRHSLRRVKQRYSDKLSEQDLNLIIDNIQNNISSVCISKQSLRVFQFLTEYKNQIYRLIYDERRKMIVTFLPIQKNLSFVEMVEYYRNKYDVKDCLKIQKSVVDDINNELTKVWKIDE